eukprot:CAMPEP_0168460864 /NCGR_PEP_ID=MMETSP0228-20121227/53668_1 /TAXON_ID=133427 /ORGANISM="Protoceratium reticulatum, Strain CCCM 535 (=CCMP 1889)" /LENGTH=56 /DNA_ID=CAMNT_0008476119 /DNA_START=62 /DNA_END=229 /DNA_ORIENTATION=-
MAAFGVMCVFLAFQGNPGGAMFLRKPHKAIQLRVLGGSDSEDEKDSCSEGGGKKVH